MKYLALEILDHFKFNFILFTVLESILILKLTFNNLLVV